MVNNVVILGGGTSGWMCAAGIAKIAPPNTKITLVESDDTGVIGVGEATIPSLTEFNDFLGLKENDVLRECQGTFKLGIDFVDWYKKGQSYFHPFGFYGRDTPEFSFHQLWLRLHDMQQKGLVPADTAGEIGEYNLCTIAARMGRYAPPQGGADSILSTMRHAYHIDSTRYGKMLRRYAEQKNVVRVEGLVVNVEQETDSGNIKSITLKNGQVLNAELFIDCSGFKSLLLNGAMGTKFIDWSLYLPCDRAIAVQSSMTGSPPPYTKATADLAGWRWRIPLQTRMGNGHVYSSQYMDDEQARNSLIKGLEGEPITEPLPLKFRTGHREKFWVKNCIGIGLASGFIEPLESTSIHLVQQGIQRLLNLWPGRGCNHSESELYNQLMTVDYERIRDFIILHYKATQREDSEFWRYVKYMPIPQTLSSKIAIFEHSGRIIPNPEDLFTPHSWLAVMLGQGIIPENYDYLVERIPENALVQNMRILKEGVVKTAGALPTHQDYINRFCAAKN